jgi:hypothetical protein
MVKKTTNYFESIGGQGGYEITKDINNMINEYQHKNSNSNLVVICQKCHDDVDRGKINIKGKVETSVGDKLILVNDDEVIIEDANNTSIEKKVIELNMKKFSQKMIKEKLSKENINLSINKISKIITNMKIS